MSDFGSRRAFQVMGIISAVVGVIYSSLHYFWLRKRVLRPPSRRASVKSYRKNGKFRRKYPFYVFTYASDYIRTAIEK